MFYLLEVGDREGDCPTLTWGDPAYLLNGSGKLRVLTVGSSSGALPAPLASLSTLSQVELYSDQRAVSRNAVCRFWTKALKRQCEPLQPALSRR